MYGFHDRGVSQTYESASYRRFLSSSEWAVREHKMRSAIEPEAGCSDNSLIWGEEASRV